MSKSIYLLGAGGHAKVLIDCLRQQNITIQGILEKNPLLFQQTLFGITILGDQDFFLENKSADEIKLVNGIGSVNIPLLRQKIFSLYREKGFQFLNVVHPTAYLGAEVILGEGVQLMARCVLQPSCVIGDNTIINTNASIDHDCRIGQHVHVAPGVVCSGGVTIGNRTHVGTGAVIVQGVTIGDDCLIAAGAVVFRDVASGSTVKGIQGSTVVS